MFKKSTYGTHGRSDTIADAVKAYSRCRKTQTFILGSTDGSVIRGNCEWTREDANAACSELAKVRCSGCGRLLSEYAPEGEDRLDTRDAYHGNRVEFHPKTGMVRPRHYVCAWSSTLGALATGDAAEAFANIRRENRAGWQRVGGAL